jgi:excisionase family DNA binding protein
MNAPGPRWITVDRAAAYLSVHSMTIRMWIDQGKIPGCRIGRAVRVDLPKLEAQLENQAAGQQKGRPG